MFFALCLCCCYKIGSAQQTSISAYYQYATKVPKPSFHYPIGFGGSISRNIYKELFLNSGFEYTSRFDENQMKITPATYRTLEIYKESIYSCYSGLSCPLLDRKFKIIVGTDLVLSYFHSSLDFSRYLVATDILDLHFKTIDSSFEFGIKGKINLEYSLSDKFSIFVQSGITHYPSNWIENLLIISPGIKFKL